MKKERGSMENQGEIILYQPDETVKLEVRLDGETVWLNRQQLSELFGRDIKTIGKHINNALKEEVSNVSVVAKFATTAADGKTYQMEYYNLDMILSVGYRVKSSRGVEFRRWANSILKEYLLKGYSVNRRLSLKDLGKKMFAFSKMNIPAEMIFKYLCFPNTKAENICLSSLDV